MGLSSRVDARVHNGMLTFFYNREGSLIEHGGVVQRKATKSWKLRDPDVELIVFGGEDEGAAKVCS